MSVIIPARNAVSTIDAAIRSLATDRALVHEILLIDDGSTDGTAGVAASTARELGLCLSVSDANFANAGACRNLGISKAEGDFLFFLDADDEVIGGGITTLVDCLHDNPKAGIAIGGYIRRAIGRKDKARVPGQYGLDRMANAANYLLNKLPSIAIGSALIDRTVVDGIRFPENIAFEEDTLFWAALLTRAQIAAVRSLVMIYNVADERYFERSTLAARSNFLNFALNLRILENYGIEKSVLKWRKAWTARRIARAFLNIGDPISARRISRFAEIHPKLRWSPTTLRYAVRIRLNNLRKSSKTDRGSGFVDGKASGR